jgi:hypothetical protein
LVEAALLIFSKLALASTQAVEVEPWAQQISMMTSYSYYHLNQTSPIHQQLPFSKFLEPFSFEISISLVGFLLVWRSYQPS